MVITLIFFLLIAFVIFKLFSGSGGKGIVAQWFSPDFAQMQKPQLLWLAVLILVVTVNIAGFGAGAFGVTSFLAVQLAVLASIVVTYSKERGKLFWTLVAVNALSGVGMVLRSNGLVQGVNLLSIWSTFVLLWVLHIYDNVHWSGLWLFKNILRLWPKQLAHMRLLAENRPSTTAVSGTSLFSWVKTAVFAVIVTLFFMLLLSNADPVFSEFVSEYLSESIERLALSLLVVSLFVFKVSQRWSTSEDNIWHFSLITLRDLGVTLVAVVSLFAFFLAVQGQYLFFATEADLAVYDLTYSEYVRKGFTELLVVTFFGGLLVYFSSVKQRLEEVADETWSKINKVCAGILGVELFLVLLSALKRDLMYVEAYGITRMRVLGFVFILWLAVALISVTLFAVRKLKEEWQVWKALLAVSVFVVAFFNIIHIDEYVSFLVFDNRERRPDYLYIANLSEDAREGWDSLVNMLEKRVPELTAQTELSEGDKVELTRAKLALQALVNHRNRLYEKYADEEFLLAHYEKFFYTSCSYNSICFLYETPHPVYQTYEYPKQQDMATITTEEKQDIIRKRAATWRSTHIGQKRMYDLMRSKEEKFGVAVESLLNQIAEYQEDQQLDLSDLEYDLLFEYEYPLVSVNPNEYDRHSFDTFRKKLGSGQEPLFFKKMVGKTSAQMISAVVNPGQPASTTTVYGVLIPQAGSIFTNKIVAQNDVSYRLTAQVTRSVEIPPATGSAQVNTGVERLRPEPSLTLTVYDPDMLVTEMIFGETGSSIDCSNQGNDCKIDYMAVPVAASIVYNQETQRHEFKKITEIKELENNYRY